MEETIGERSTEKSEESSIEIHMEEVMERRRKGYEHASDHGWFRLR